MPPKAFHVLRTVCILMACLTAANHLPQSLHAGDTEESGKAVAVLPADAKTLQAAQAVNAFGGRLYTELAKTEGNLAFSPLSIEQCLLMLSGGAQGKSLQQITDLLKLSPQDAPALKTLRESFTGGKPGDNNFRLTVCDSFWADRSLTLRPEYVRYLQTNFAAEAKNVPFQTDPETARAQINDWIAQKTNQMLPNLLVPGSVTSQTRLMLCDTVYFDARWAMEFSPRATRPQKFSNAVPGKSSLPPSMIRMMHQESTMSYQKGKDFHAIRLPYYGDTFSMIVVLPLENAGLDAADRAWAQHAKWFQTRSEVVDLSLPRFELSTNTEIDSLLVQLGATDIFSTRKAQLGGISPEPLYVDSILHACRVEVNEERTRAAAATYAGLAPACIPPQPVVFTVDRPFVFLIRHEASKLVLFAGRVCTLPSVSEAAGK